MIKPSPPQKKRRRRPAPLKPLPPSRDQGSFGAWSASLGLHGGILLLIALFGSSPPPEITSQPIELVDIVTDHPMGDQLAAAMDLAAPKTEPAPVMPRDAVEQRSAPADDVEAPEHAETAAAPTKTLKIPEPDVEALLAQRERTEREREAKRIGELTAAAPGLDESMGSDRQTSSRFQGGASDNGSGLTGDLGQRRILEKVQPAYPEAARRTGVEGDVRLRVYVSAEGAVGRVDVVKYSGTPEMDKRAIEALKRWRFAPLPEGASAGTQWGEITMHFRLD